MKGGRAATTVFLLAGLALLALTGRSVGWTELAASVRSVSVPGALVFLLVYPLACAWDVAGWLVLFPKEAAGRVQYAALYWIRLAGEAINSVTPFADVGGEPLKTELSSSCFGISRRAAFSSVLASRAVLLYSEVVFWVLGLALAWPRLPRTGLWQTVMVATLCSGAGLAAAVYAIQRRGVERIAVGLCSLLGLPLSARLREGLQEADRHVAEIYTARIGVFWTSFGLHLAGWIAGAAEIYVVFIFCGADAGWKEALVLEALLHLTKTASFFVPGNIGAQEAGLALGAGWMGVSPALGVATSLLKRCRQIVWGLAGLAALGLYRRAMNATSKDPDNFHKEKSCDESQATATTLEK